jgi:hypothetical protein
MSAVGLMLLRTNTCHQPISTRASPVLTVFSATTIMSAAQKVQNHPAFIQAQNKANYYAGQLDKEASLARTKPLLFF